VFQSTAHCYDLMCQVLNIIYNIVCVELDATVVDPPIFKKCKRPKLDHYALEQRYVGPGALTFVSKVNCHCECGRKVGIKDVAVFGRLYWRDGVQRKNRIKNYLETLRSAWERVPGSKQFIFYIGNVQVCELFFRSAIGIPKAPLLWRNVSDRVTILH